MMVLPAFRLGAAGRPVPFAGGRGGRRDAVPRFGHGILGVGLACKRGKQGSGERKPTTRHCEPPFAAWQTRATRPARRRVALACFGQAASQ